MSDWAPPSAALDPDEFRELYRGALALSDDERRVEACYAVLATGRLGLHPSEVVHCHEGWIDWTAGTIVVPAKDPCACADCYEAARERRAYDEPILDVLYETCWTPAARSARTISFGWSPRIAAVLATCFDRRPVLDEPGETVDDLLAAAAAETRSLSADAVDVETMGATAASFFGDLGLAPATTASVLGVDRGQIATFCSVGGPVQDLYRHAGAAGLSDTMTAPAEQFPIACAWAPLDDEPFDLAQADLDSRKERDTDDTPPETNPRTVDVSDTVEYDEGDHVSAATPEGGAASESASTPAGTGTDSAAPGDATVTDQSGSSVAAGSGQSSQGTDAASDGSGGTVAGGGAASGVDAPGMPDSPDAPDDGGIDDVGQDEVQTDAAARSASATGETPREVLTDPIVANLSATMTADDVTGGAFRGRLLLGQAELLVLATTDADVTLDEVDHRVIPLGAVTDVALDYVPDGMDDTFDNTIALAYDPGDDSRRVVVAELNPSNRWDLASALYRILLNVTPVQVRHPARIAGRVMDTDAEPMVMYVRPKRVEFTDRAGETVQCSFHLDDIIHVERDHRTTADGTVPVVSIRHVSENRPTTTTVAVEEERLLELFGRYVRRVYRHTLAEVRDVSLTDHEKMLLVALYSTDDQRDISDVISLDGATLSEAVDSLSAAGLVRVDGDLGVQLTGKGQLAVSDRLDAVNE